MRKMERFGKLFDLTGHVAVVTGAAQGNWVTMLCGKLGDATTGSNISITCGQVTL